MLGVWLLLAAAFATTFGACADDGDSHGGLAGATGSSVGAGSGGTGGADGATPPSAPAEDGGGGPDAGTPDSSRHPSSGLPACGPAVHDDDPCVYGTDTPCEQPSDGDVCRCDSTAGGIWNC